MEAIYAFLTELKQNNNRDWFNANKARYQDALDLFREFAGSVIGGIAGFDPSVAALEPKDVIFRIHKDIRFSRDKTPYKTHFGCWMAKGGRKSTGAGYYFHMQPGGSFMAAGVHMPPREQLNLIRQEIVFNPEAYLAIIGDPALKKGYERAGADDMFKKVPAGFPKDFKHAGELLYKQYIYSKEYTDSEVCRKGFSSRLTEDYRRLSPLVAYLNHAMSFTGNQ
jgi:uncharacterized protein (TIGR02453 family)